MLGVLNQVNIFNRATPFYLKGGRKLSVALVAADVPHEEAPLPRLAESVVVSAGIVGQLDGISQEGDRDGDGRHSQHVISSREGQHVPQLFVGLSEAPVKNPATSRLPARASLCETAREGRACAAVSTPPSVPILERSPVGHALGCGGTIDIAVVEGVVSCDLGDKGSDPTTVNL